MLIRANKRLSREARSVEGELAERAQEKRKSVRIFRKVGSCNLTAYSAVQRHTLRR